MSYVQYGCGLSAPEGWLNFDASPTLRVQRIPVVGKLVRPKLNVVFPDNVRYGDIVKGLPVPDQSCSGVYSSHVLEHLSYEDCHKALDNSYRILAEGGVFRLVMPDLHQLAKNYLAAKEKSEGPSASHRFMRNTGMATETRQRDVKSLASFLFSSRHLWLWDQDAIIYSLRSAGFRDIRPCEYGDSPEPMFDQVEDRQRFDGSLAVEARR